MLHLSEGPTPGPRGGDWVSGERVFGPPRGTVEADWFVPLVLEAHPDTPHERARAAVRFVWAVVREEAELAGVVPADVDEAAVRRRLGPPLTADGATPAAAPADPVLATALHVVLAAGRAYGG